MRSFNARFAAAACSLAVLLGWAAAGNAQQDNAQEDKPKPKSDAKPSAPADEGRAQLLKAFEISKTAQSAKEFSQMIDLCDSGIAATESDAFKAYGHRLAAWACWKRGGDLASGSSPKDKEALADFDAAAKHLDAAGGQRPDWEFDLLHSRGASHAATGQIEKALADFNGVIRLRPTFGKGYYNRGEMQAGLGDYDKALADFDLALRYGYNDAVVYTARGFANYQKERIDAAIADYGRAIARNRGSYEAYTLRGDAYYASGRHAEAIRDYQQAMTINNRYARVYHSAAWLRATCPAAQYRNAETALRNAQYAIELGGDDARNLRVLAAAQARSGQFGEAIETASKALEKANGDKDEEDLLKRMLEGFQAKRAYESVASAGAKVGEKKKQP